MTVTLRRLGQLGDKTVLFEWANSLQVLPFMYRDHIISHDEHERWYFFARDDENKFIIELDGQAVGFAQCSVASEKDRRWTWGHYIAEPSARGMGVGKAVEFLMTDHIFNAGAYKISIEAFADNERVIAIHERFGYRPEACYLRHIWKGGVWRDVIGLAMTAEEWTALRELRLEWLGTEEKEAA